MKYAQQSVSGINLLIEPLLKTETFVRSMLKPGFSLLIMVSYFQKRLVLAG
jgi:hypothetical protein